MFKGDTVYGYLDNKANVDKRMDRWTSL